MATIGRGGPFAATDVDGDRARRALLSVTRTATACAPTAVNVADTGNWPAPSPNPAVLVEVPRGRCARAIDVDAAAEERHRLAEAGRQSPPLIVATGARLPLAGETLTS